MLWWPKSVLNTRISLVAVQHETRSQAIRQRHFCLFCLQNVVYGKALAEASEAPATASSYHDSYVVEPSWGRDLSSLPPGVARIVDGARKLFEVKGSFKVTPVQRQYARGCRRLEAT